VASQDAAWDQRKTLRPPGRRPQGRQRGSRQKKIWRGASMSKGCDETAGDTSGNNPDPETPSRRRGQASRKGGRERGSENEEARSLTWRESRDRSAECQGRSRGRSLTGAYQSRSKHVDGESGQPETHPSEATKPRIGVSRTPSREPNLVRVGKVPQKINRRRGACVPEVRVKR
jgi:hypothetical protein